MKRSHAVLSRLYEATLGKHLKSGTQLSLKQAQRLGRKAAGMGLETLELARIHEQALARLALPGKTEEEGNHEMIRQSAFFFAEAITPIEKTHRIARESEAHLSRANVTLNARTKELAASNLRLKREIAERRTAEGALRKSEQHFRELLQKSRKMQDQLRFLSRELLSAQEEERKRISRELHDVIAQTLTSINLQLGTLKANASTNSKELEREITRTQLLVEQSVNIVHRFARELRPTVLDDLGLVPALHTYLKGFRERTGKGVRFSAYSEVETISSDKRTVLYRIAQEALTNVARHSKATETEVKIQKSDGMVQMVIKDNGKGFVAGRVSQGNKRKRLGLLGMRERVEMVRGRLAIQSKPGKGTTILAEIPLL